MYHVVLLFALAGFFGLALYEAAWYVVATEVAHWTHHESDVHRIAWCGILAGLGMAVILY